MLIPYKKYLRGDFFVTKKTAKSFHLPEEYFKKNEAEERNQPKIQQAKSSELLYHGISRVPSQETGFFFIFPGKFVLLLTSEIIVYST